MNYMIEATDAKLMLEALAFNDIFTKTKGCVTLAGGACGSYVTIGAALQSDLTN